MARPSRKKFPKPHGRQVKPIDWDLVDELLLSGCPGTEIAPHFDMHVHTFYDRVLIEKGVLFTEYSIEKRSKGDSLLRNVQFNKALGISDKGDNTMLVWLGKNRLNQRETAEVSVPAETIKAFGSMMQQLDGVQKMRLQNLEEKKEEEMDND